MQTIIKYVKVSIFNYPNPYSVGNVQLTKHFTKNLKKNDILFKFMFALKIQTLLFKLAKKII